MGYLYWGSDYCSELQSFYLVGRRVWEGVNARQLRCTSGMQRCLQPKTLPFPYADNFYEELD